MRRNKLTILLVVLIFIFGCTGPLNLSQGDISSQISENFLLHEDSVYKVKILYPNTWEFVETNENVFAFKAPKSPTEALYANINLIMNDVSGQELTFDRFKELALEDLKQTVEDFTLIESTSTTLAGSPAQKNIFTAFNPKVKLLQVITIKDDITYAITFISEPDSFESYLPIVQKMLDSFDIIGNIRQEQPVQDNLDEQIKGNLDQPEIKVEEGKVEPKMTGTYRCWSYNVQGAGKSCTSPPIVLNEDETYSMSSEKGTYTVDGDTIILSESKIRGPGKILEDGMQIRFEYDYNGWHHTMTYLKADWDTPQQEAGEEGITYVEVSLNIIFPEGTSVSGINSAALLDNGETVGETLAYESAPNTVRALFRKLATKPGIPTGKVYTVQVSSGFGYWDVGVIDLRNVKEDVELEVYAKTDETTSENTPSPDTTQDDNEQAVTEPETPVSETPPSNAPKCDPNIPKYSQPGCVE